MTTDVLHQVVLPRLKGIRKSGDGYSACCPAHDDSSPSLSLKVGSEHPVLLTCHAGCEPEAILTELGLTWEDVTAPRENRPTAVGEWTPAGQASDVYDYRDETGHLLFQVLRVPQADGKKTFLQRVPDVNAASGWRWRLGETRRVLYRLPELVDATEAGQVVWICEGEKDVHALVRAGVAATCNPGGAGKWMAEYTAFFIDARVRIVADRDKPGQAHARAVADALAGIAASVAIVEPATGKDAADHLAAGRGIEEFATTWESETTAAIDLAIDLNEFLAQPDEETVWVIPDLIARGDRLVWTGFEGLGKSIVVRQLAVAAAVGLHPFDGPEFPPQRVLMIDCENSETQSRKHYRRMAAVAQRKGRPVPDGGMFLMHRPEGLDLSRPDDAAWLMERVTVHNPDLLVIGPFYQLHDSESEEERGARKVTRNLRMVRDAVGCAVVVEHHSPHGGPGGRSVRPFGSSLLLRWPEMGMGIMPTENGEWPVRRVLVKPWRGNRDTRYWPRALKWGEGPANWPWVVDIDRAMEHG